MDMVTSDTLKIYNLCIELQRKNRVIGTLYGTDLTLVESQILIELGIDPTTDILKLARKLSLNQSTISRAVQKLAKNQLVGIEKDTEDKRKSILSLKPAALPIMKKINLSANKILEEFSKNLKPNELDLVISVTEKILDNFGIEKAELRKNEHPFRSQQRRLARLIKILSVGDISHPEHHLLKLLNDRNGSIIPTQLAQTLGLKTSAISILIRDLKKQKFIESNTQKSDARFENINITETGKNKLLSSQTKQIKSLLPAVKKLNQSEREKFIELFAKFITDPNQTISKFDKQYSIQALKTDSQRSNARIEYLKSAVKNNHLESVPEKIFDSGSSCFGLFNNSNLIAAVQYNQKKEVTCYYSSLNPELYLFDKYFKENSRKKL